MLRRLKTTTTGKDAYESNHGESSFVQAFLCARDNGCIERVMSAKRLSRNSTWHEATQHAV